VALELPRHGNSDFRLSRVVENVDAAIAYQLSTGAKYDPSWYQAPGVSGSMPASSSK
jgi:hypothetical protein